VGSTSDRSAECTVELRAARQLAATLGETSIEIAVLCNMSAFERSSGDHQAVARHAEEAKTLLAGTDAPATLRAVGGLNLAYARLLAGSEQSDVTEVFVQTLGDAATARSPAVLICTLVGLAEAMAEAQPETASDLLGTAVGLHREHGLTWDPTDKTDFERARNEIATQLDEGQLNGILESVDNLSLDQAIERARTLALQATAPTSNNERPT
jgi:hypothetical protein